MFRFRSRSTLVLGRVFNPLDFGCDIEGKVNLFVWVVLFVIYGSMESDKKFNSLKIKQSVSPLILYDMCLNYLQTEWTKGKLNCPNCEARVGSFDFTARSKCACGSTVLPAVHLVKSKVDSSPQDNLLASLRT